jgi:predicted dehydrogenase
VAICDPVRAKAEARSNEFGNARVYTDFAEMLDREKPDAVDIATPVATHAQSANHPRTCGENKKGVQLDAARPF